MTPSTLFLYEPIYSLNNHLVVGMWNRMVNDGDIPSTFHPVMTLPRFLAMIQPPNGLLYAGSHDGIWFGMWFEPFLAGLSVGAWVRKDYRRTRQGLAAFLEGYRLLLDQVPCLFGVTMQEKLLPAHIGLGYDVLGRAPALWDGHRDAWLVMLTRAGHTKARERLCRRATVEAVHG